MKKALKTIGKILLGTAGALTLIGVLESLGAESDGNYDNDHYDDIYDDDWGMMNEQD